MTWRRLRRSPRLWVRTLILLTALSQASGQVVMNTGWKTINGTRLYYKSIGQGTPVVILHGGPGLDHSYLLPQMERLAEHYQLIFFDQRACGRSSMDVDTNSLTIETLVEDIEGVRRAFGLGKMHLLAHSWGGLLAMRYAIRYSHSLNSLILVTPTPASAELRQASLKIMKQHVSKEDSIAQTALMQTEEFAQRTPQAMAKYFRLVFRGSFYRRSMADSLTLRFGFSYPVSSKLMKHLAKDRSAFEYNLHPQLGQISCPTLIIGADYDQVPPESNTLIHEQIKNSKHIVLKECGHFPYIEQPDKFFDVVNDFLDGVNENR